MNRRAFFAFYVGEALGQLDQAPRVSIVGQGPTRPRWVALFEWAATFGWSCAA